MWRIVWMVMFGLVLLTVASLASYSPYDAPSHSAAPLNASPANWCGQFGAVVAYKLLLMFGAGAWVLVAAVAACLIRTAAGWRADQLMLRSIGAVIVAVSTSGLLALFVPNAGSMPEGAGGLLAIVVVNELAARFSTLGTALMLAMCFGVGAMLAADELVLAAPRGLMSLLKRLTAISMPRPAPLGRALGSVLTLPRIRRRNTDQPARKPVPVRHGAAVAEEPDKRAKSDNDKIPESAGGLGATESFDPDETAPVSVDVVAGDEPEEADEEVDEVESASAEPQVKKPLDAAALREKIRKLPITFAAANKPAKPAVQPKQDLSGYRFPGMDLLEEPESNFTEQMAKLVREQAEVLERALQMYKINAEVVAIDAGPVITLYEVQLAPGTKVSQISAISSDVARELKAQNIRIVPNTAGKSTVGIEVPNLKKEKVRLKELMALAGSEIFEKMNLPMFLAKDASGNPLIADLATMPHMLIAGTTGSGKSVCINSIIMSFLFARRPDELKLVLVDPKMVEMAQFRDIPHLMCPVVTEMSKAAAILEWAVTKMDERYELLAEAGVRDVDSYNALTWKDLAERFDPQTPEEEAEIPRKLPRMVFIIDELADLILTHKEVEGFIVRIAQKARAVGIHLILATQRPQANVVTGLIKSNMPCRVSFKVASGMDSRIVLDSKGAELLLGQGDMLYLSPRTSKLLRAQGTLVDDKEVRAVVRFLKTIAEQSFEPQLVQLRAPSAADGENSAERDPLFEDAVQIVLETKRGSVSLLQRRLTIGYSRASRLIEQMAEAGIIGEYKGSQAREVTMTLEEWEQIKAHAEAVAADPETELESLAESDDDELSDEEQELAELATEEADAAYEDDADEEDEDDDEFEYVEDEDAEYEEDGEEEEDPDDDQYVYEGDEDDRDG